jgi:long-chain acyl-CoA synthetase
MSNFIDAFIRSLDARSELTAIITDHNEFSYSDLDAQISLQIKQYESNGVSEGNVVSVIGDFDLLSIASIFALIKLKAIVVPILKTHNYKYIQNCERISLADFSSSVEGISMIDGISQSSSSNLLLNSFREDKAAGLILFTSGTTADPKAALHNLDKLLYKFQNNTTQKRMINFLMFDHWGGLNTMFYILSGGGTLIATENRSPEQICKLIDSHSVQVLPASPSFLNLLLLSKAYDKYNLESIETISYGSEPMLESTLKKMNAIFPGVSFKQTYGLIELGVFKTKSKGNDSLLIKIDESEAKTRIIGGQLEIKTSMAMMGYLNAESPFTADGWFKTGDMVSEEGSYIKILGRNSDLINIGGEKVYPAEVESVIIELDNVRDVVVSKEIHPLLGNMIVAKVNLERHETLLDFTKRLRIHCLKKLAKYKVPSKIIITQEVFQNSRLKKTRRSDT